MAQIRDNIGLTFIEGTKHRKEPSDQMKGLPQPPLERAPNPDQTVIDLPDPAKVEVGRLDLSQAINERTSLRKYSDAPLSLGELSYLLWSTQGVRQVTARPATLRTVPSAGSRHPFETYLLINRVEGLQPGLYHFHGIPHKLAVHDLDPELTQKITAAGGNQGFIAASALTFIWVADVYRTFWRYQERGYRYLFIDAGHVCQNAYLAAQAIGGGCCAIGAFDDDEMARLLGLDGRDQMVVYMAAVGKR